MNYLIGMAIWIALIMLYSLIARTLYKQRRRQIKTLDSQTSGIKEKITVGTEMQDKERQVTHANNSVNTCVAESIKSDKTVTNQRPQITDLSFVQRIPGFRISVMFMVITAVYMYQTYRI